MRLRITRRRLLVATIIGASVVLISVELYVLSPSVRAVAVSGAERVGADEFLIGRLADYDLKVRSDARAALVRRGAKAVPALVARLDDPVRENRASAAATLGHIGPAAGEAIPALLRRAVEDENEEVQEITGRALGLVARHHPGAVLELLALLGSPADSSRLAAIRASAHLADPRAIPPLIASLSHANPKVREEAAEALGALGTLSAPAIPALIEILGDPVALVRSEAREALAKIIRGGSTAVDPELVTRAKRALEKPGPEEKK